MAKVQVAFRIDESVLAEVDTLAERLGLSRTAVFERCVVSGLEEGKKNANHAENPLIRLMIRMVASFEGSEIEQDELEKILTSIKDHKKQRQSHAKSRGKKEAATKSKESHR